MEKGVISKRSIDALEPSEREFVFWDGALKGFGVRVQPSGTKTFVFRYRSPLARNKSSVPPKTVTIGRSGVVTPDQARTEAKSLAALVMQGVDPVDRMRQTASQLAVEKAAAEKAANDAETMKLRSLTVDFLRHILAASPASH